MNVVFIFFFCATIFMPTFVNGLECYECSICSNPFDKTNATITTTNSTNESCYKTSFAITTIRGVKANCVATNALGLGTWCCNTDLCNAAQSTVSTNLKLLISTFLLIIGVIKMIQSN